jgi:3-dehydroquinate synthase
MKTITITTPSKSYPVFVGENVLTNLIPFLKGLDPLPKNILIISDQNVANLYLNQIKEILEDDFHVETFVLRAGDHQKSFENFYACHSFALEKELDRSSLILALGGGMIGDFSGFIAGTYMRGIRFVQVPTTLLAHDSAVGGKTGINHPLGKNMIGVFHQPEAVFYSTELLRSLPEKEIRSGFAEVIKHALIYDKNFYNWLHNNIRSIEELKSNNLFLSITRGIEIKNEVVTQDETEKGVRAVLNFGHTLAHAIEAEFQYRGITHGEAVAHGMLFALSFQEETKDIMEELSAWLADLGLDLLPTGLSAQSLIQRMKKDKKASGGSIHMVLLKEIGSPFLRKVTEEELEEKLIKFLP